jgi:hypothetical protein
MRESRKTGQGAEHRQAGTLDGVLQDRPMTVGAHAVEDYPRNPHGRIVPREALHQRPHRLRHARGIDGQDYGQMQEPREVRRSASSLGRRPVEEAHGAFDHQSPRAPREGA